MEPGHSNALPPNNLRPLLARAHCAAHHAERDGYIRILVLGGIENDDFGNTGADQAYIGWPMRKRKSSASLSSLPKRGRELTTCLR